MSLRITGVGCALLDTLYTNVKFDAPAFAAYRSRRPGDGGLVPGKLTFADDLAEFAGKPYPRILSEITGGARPDARNLGGPAIVALIHAAQLLEDLDVTVEFYGRRGEDEPGRILAEMAARTPIRLTHYAASPGATPETDVFSDPSYHDGSGERTFVNVIGTAGSFGPADLDESFFQADIAVFGGTALVPGIHDGLTGLLERARAAGAATVVNTVFDFRSEQRNPGGIWPLGDRERSFQLIDLLILDYEEALRLSGTGTKRDAVEYFRSRGVGACIVTHGPEPVACISSGTLFAEQRYRELPVSEAVGAELRSGSRRGDTTGCGDNFAGGVIAALARWTIVHGKPDRTVGSRPGAPVPAERRLREAGKRPDILQAAAWGIVSGGFACFYTGGTYIESMPGEKLRRIVQYYEAYRAQLARSPGLVDRVMLPSEL